MKEKVSHGGHRDRREKSTFDEPRKTQKASGRPLAATKLLNYGIRGKRGKGYRRIEKFVKNVRHVRCSK